MNRERLEHAIAEMERVQDGGLPFNMIYWVAYESDPYNCNTAACFAGWCARDPIFREAGLRLEEGLLAFEDSYNVEAVAVFFGISYDSARWLVFPSEYPGRPVSIDMVIERLRLLLANDGVVP